LSDLAPDRRSEFATEIAHLRRAAAMRELSTRSSQTKIFVDTEKITESLSDAFKDRVGRCLAYTQQLTQNLRRSLKSVGIDLAKIGRAPVLYIDSSFEMFRDIFKDLTYEFISSNEWGLDSNLSQRIRHGTLSGKIRELFERRNLITLKDAAGNY